MAFGKPLTTWDNKTEGPQGGDVVPPQGQGGGMVRPRKRKGQAIINKKTYRFESLDS